MNTLISLVPLLCFLTLYTGLVKLGALVYARTQLQWRHALVFSGFNLVCAVVGRYTKTQTYFELPLLVAPLVALTILVAFGSWYFGTRARRRTGEPLGMRRAVFLVVIVYGIVFLIGVVMAILIPWLAQTFKH
jgi:hypothetical protein